MLASTDILKLFRETNLKLKEGFSGLLLIIDELGKFLEFEARNQEYNDIYYKLAEETLKNDLISH